MDFNSLKILANTNTDLKYDLIALSKFIFPNSNRILDIDSIIDYYEYLRNQHNDLNFLSSLEDKFEFFEEFFNKIITKYNLTKLIQDTKDSVLLVSYPDKFTVGLVYDKEKHEAPVVLFKTDSDFSEGVVSIAEANDIIVFEKPIVAKYLHSTIEIDSEITEDFYIDVANMFVKLNRSKE